MSELKVIKIITYRCPICASVYGDTRTKPEDAKRLAESCLAKGIAPVYPPGCMYGNNKPGAFYEHMTFAVAFNKVYQRPSLYGHMNLGGSWACRDNGYGDSLYEQTCGGNSLSLSVYDSHLDPTTNHFKRMVKYLQENCLPITVWDGTKPIPYEDFMKKWESEQK